MGGNALRDICPTRRYEAGEYHLLTKEVLEKIRGAFPQRRIDVLPAYRNKPSFGDMDILMESDGLTVDIRHVIRDLFPTRGMVKNSNCLSFEFKELQIDLALQPSAIYQSSLDYYSWNDLGNLIGRISHKLGFKFGHEGLTAVYRDGLHEYGKVNVSQDTDAILTFLGYDSKIFRKGFDDLTDIFVFASSTPYFNAKIFDVENRNYTARVRDAKRANYRGFLEWIEGQEGLPAYPWASMKELGGTIFKEQFLHAAFEVFPGFLEKHQQVMEDYQIWKEFREILNGENVSQWTGLTGKDLGIFMSDLRKEYQMEKKEWHLFIVEMGRENLENLIREKNAPKMQNNY